MKQFRLSVAVLLSVWSLAGNQVANADGGSGLWGIKIEKSDIKKIRVYAPTVNASTGQAQSDVAVNVAIIDADGTVLYNGVMAKNAAGRQSFNLRNLPDGHYFVTASSKTWWMSQGLTITGNRLTVDQQNVRVVEEPTLTAYEKNKIEMTLPTQNVRNANVTIYDAHNVAVYDETFRGNSRRFDLSSLPDGAYTFIVGAAEKQFTTRVDVQH